MGYFADDHAFNQISFCNIGFYTEELNDHIINVINIIIKGILLEKHANMQKHNEFADEYIGLEISLSPKKEQTKITHNTNNRNKQYYKNLK